MNSWKTIYHSQFGRARYKNSVSETVYVSIQEYTEDTVSNIEISMPYDTPVTIEWSPVSKEQPIQGATCTLRVISDTDRQFLPLYSKPIGSIRVVITGSGTGVPGHWSGLLDIENYEEPYSIKEGYETTLTFTDFGFLDRYDFDMLGIKTFRQIIESALDRLDISYHAITENISTKIDNQTNASLSAMSIDCSNFYDEDGSPMTYKGVLDSILQPIAAKIIQKGSLITIYDYHSLFSQQQLDIVWSGDDATLSLDQFVNKIIITLSNYSRSNVGDDDIRLPYDFEKFKYLTNIDNPTPIGQIPCKYFSWYESQNRQNQEAVSFTMFYMDSLTNEEKGYLNVTYNTLYCNPFKVNPINGGDECQGICQKFKTHYEQGITCVTYGDANPFTLDQNTVLFSVTFPRLQKMEHPELFNLNLKMEMMIDYHYNPFNGDDQDNDPSSASEKYKYYAHTFKPILVELLDDNDNVIMFYSNAPYLDRLCNRQMWAWNLEGSDWTRWDDETWRLNHSWTDVPDIRGKLAWNYMPINSLTKGDWYYPNDSWFNKVSPICWLDYHKEGDIVSTLTPGCGTIGWNVNKHNVGSVCGTTKYFDSIANGQKIPYPPVGGRIRIKVLRGYEQHGNFQPFDPRSTASYITKKGFTHDERWVLYKYPSITVVKDNVIYDDDEYDDEEISCYVNTSAADSLEVSLNCGTAIEERPSSRAMILRSSDNMQLHTLVRGDYTGTASELLAGTLFSQYHGRKIILKGSARYNNSGPAIYRDSSMPFKCFVISGEVADLKQGTSDATYVEVSDDVYEKSQIS